MTQPRHARRKPDGSFGGGAEHRPLFGRVSPRQRGERGDDSVSLARRITDALALSFLKDA